MTRERRRSGALDPLLPSAKDLVARLGRHPASTLGLDLDLERDADVCRWLVASILLAGRTPEAAALDAYRQLEQRDWTDPLRLAEADFEGVQQCLETAGVANDAAVAALLGRVCTTLARTHEGSIDRLVADAEGLEALAGRLSQLGTGFGRAAILRFLTPLRDRWSAAGDLPASAAVLAAGQDLGWIPATQDQEGAAASLARQATGADHPAARDVEAALERLGRAACLRGRVERCPLAEACPRRERA